MAAAAGTAIGIGLLFIFYWGAFAILGGLALAVAAYWLLSTGQSRAFVSLLLTLACTVVGSFWGLILIAWLSGFPGN